MMRRCFIPFLAASFLTGLPAQPVPQPPTNLTVLTFPLIATREGVSHPDGPYQIAVIRKICRYATEHNLFPGYELKLEDHDDKCTGRYSAGIGWELSKRTPYNPLILGPTCSSSCSKMANWVHLWNAHALSRCSLMTLADPDVYPGWINIERMMPNINNMKLQVVKYNGWKSCFVACQSEEIFTTSVSDLLERTARLGIDVQSVEVFNDAEALVKRLVNQEARIIVMLVYSDMMAKVLCAAKKYGLYGPKTVFILRDALLPRVTTKHCDIATVNEVFESGILIGNHVGNALFNGHRSELGHTYDEVVDFLQEWENTTDEFPVPNSRFDSYDLGMGFIAFLREIFTEIEKLGGGLRYENLAKEPNAKMYNIIESVKKKIYVKAATYDFLDFTNPLQRMLPGDAQQMVNGELVKQLILIPRAGASKEEHGDVDFRVEKGRRFIWQTKNGQTPRDSVYYHERKVEVDFTLYALVNTAAGLSIILSLGIIGVQVRYRDRRVIKMSSPKLNVIIVSGCMICVTVVSMHRVEDSLRSFFCKFRIVVFVTGFSLLYGTLFAKVYRVHQLFIKVVRNATAVKDRRLFVFVAFWLILSYLYLTVWFLADPYHDVYREATREQDPLDEDIRYIYMTHQCTSVYEFYFMGGLLILHGLLLTVGGFLAVLTRNVYLKEVVDSRQIEICIYVVATCSILASIGLLLINHMVNLSYGMSNIICVVGITSVEIVLFQGRLPFMVDGTKLNQVSFVMNGGSNSNNGLATANPGKGSDKSPRPSTSLAVKK